MGPFSIDKMKKWMGSQYCYCRPIEGICWLRRVCLGSR